MIAPPVKQELSVEYPLSVASGLALWASYPVSATHKVWLGKKFM